MTYSQYPEKASYTAEVSDRKGMSAGAGIALVGVCLTAAVLSIFFSLLFFTDRIAPGTTAAIESYSNEQDSGVGLIVYALIPFAPLVAAYFLGKVIIKKG